MYDRNNCCASEAGKIVAFAKDYFDSKGAQFCYTLSRVLELDTQTVSMYLAKYYVDNYDYVNQRPLNLSFTNSTKAVVIYLSWLLICILVRVMPRGRPSSSRFIRFLLDKVEFSNEVSRFEKLFAGSTESVAAITTREDLKHSFQNYGMASKYADQIPILGLISLCIKLEGFLL